MREWASTENRLLKYRNRMEKNQLRRKIQLTAVVVLTSGLGKCKSSRFFHKQTQPINSNVIAWFLLLI